MHIVTVPARRLVVRGILIIAGILVFIHGMTENLSVADERSDLEQIELEIKLREFSEKPYSIAYDRTVKAIGNSSLEKQRVDLVNKSLLLQEKARGMRKQIVENNDLVASELTGLPKSCLESFRFLSPEYTVCEEKYSHVFSLVYDDPEIQEIDVEADNLIDESIVLRKKTVSIREKFTEQFYLEEMRNELEKLKIEITEEILERTKREFLETKSMRV